MHSTTAAHCNTATTADAVVIAGRVAQTLRLIANRDRRTAHHHRYTQRILARDPRAARIAVSATRRAEITAAHVAEVAA